MKKYLVKPNISHLFIHVFTNPSFTHPTILHLTKNGCVWGCTRGWAQINKTETFFGSCAQACILTGKQMFSHFKCHQENETGGIEVHSFARHSSAHSPVYSSAVPSPETGPLRAAPNVYWINEWEPAYCTVNKGFIWKFYWWVPNLNMHVFWKLLFSSDLCSKKEHSMYNIKIRT